MKKILSLALALLLMLGLAACGDDGGGADIDDAAQVSSEEEIESSSDVENSSQSKIESSSNEDVDSSQEQSSDNDEDWREFLADYEDWVDDYIEIYQKYQKNPTDMSILADYTELAGETASWAEKADEIEMDVSAEDLAEYTATLSRIVQKLSSAMY